MSEDRADYGARYPGEGAEQLQQQVSQKRINELEAERTAAYNGQQTVSLAAFLFARQDIDDLLGIVFQLKDSRQRWIESAERLRAESQEQAAGR